MAVGSGAWAKRVYRDLRWYHKQLHLLEPNAGKLVALYDKHALGVGDSIEEAYAAPAETCRRPGIELPERSQVIYYASPIDGSARCRPLTLR